MPSLYTTVDINAPKAVVWDALITKDQWLQWNTYLFDRAPSQDFKVGRSLLFSLKRRPREPETTFQAQITHVQPEAFLRWVALAPGYRSEHSFELQDMGVNRTQYIHRQRISGALSWLFLPFIRQDEQAAMQRMAEDLKYHSEHRQLP